jgi:hypothetical protein
MNAEGDDAQAASRWPQNVALLAGAVGGLAFGRGMSIIPSPSTAGVFWIGNLCAPWLVIAFVAGRYQRTWLRSAAAGMIATTGCVVGFYVHFLFLGGPAALGLPRSTPFMPYASAALTGWLHFTAFWLITGVVSGALYGLLSQWWRRSAPLAGALAIGLPFVTEPELWTVREGNLRTPWALWAAEIGVGVVVTFLLIRQSRKAPRPHRPSSDAVSPGPGR